MLQYKGEALGSIIDRSPKCTPEIAGDGIEFDWAMAKLWYRKLVIENNKKKELFLDSVKRALSDEVVSIERTRHFSRRARLNMVGYYKLSKDKKATTPTELKRFKTEHKSHTCMANDCFGYITNKVNRLFRKGRN